MFTYTRPRFTAPSSFLSATAQHRMHAHCVSATALGVVTLLFVMLVCQGTIVDAAACAAPVSEIPAGAFDPNTDYFPAKANVDHATLFKLTYHQSYKVLTVVNLQGLTEAYILVQRGAPQPTSLPAYIQSASVVKNFTIPLTSVGLMETVSNGFVQALGLINSARFVSSYSVSACVQQLLAQFPERNADATDIVTAATQTDAVFTSSCCLDWSYPCSSPCVGATDAKYVNFRVTAELSFLAAAEWAHVMAAFFNLECASTELLSVINTRYACSTAKVTAAAASDSTTPIAAIVSTDGASWWSFSSEDKLTSMAAAAGARVFVPPTVMLSSVADFHSALVSGGVQHLILRDYITSDASSVQAAYGFTSADSYSYWKLDKKATSSGSTDEFEGMLVEPDALVQEFAVAFRPALAGSLHRANSTFVWLRNIKAGVTATYTEPSQCADFTVTPTSHAAACSS